MPLKLTNLAASKLAADLSAVSVFLQLDSADSFPLLEESTDWYPIAVVNDQAQTEFMRVIGRAGNTLQVRRAQEGSIAREYHVGDVVELRLTVAGLDEIRTLGVA